jgi:hypothetical protein
VGDVVTVRDVVTVGDLVIAQPVVSYSLTRFCRLQFRAFSRVTS